MEDGPFTAVSTFYHATSRASEYHSPRSTEESSGYESSGGNAQQHGKRSRDAVISEHQAETDSIAEMLEGIGRKVTGSESMQDEGKHKVYVAEIFMMGLIVSVLGVFPFLV